jgi:hypothetical protein
MSGENSQLNGDRSISGFGDLSLILPDGDGRFRVTAKNAGRLSKRTRPLMTNKAVSTQRGGFHYYFAPDWAGAPRIRGFGLVHWGGKAIVLQPRFQAVAARRRMSGI